MRDFEAEIHIGGLVVPMTLSVVRNLAFDLILGVDFLHQTSAVIDIKNRSLVLQDGLTSVPLTTSVQLLIVSTINAITIPPFRRLFFRFALIVAHQ